MKAKKLEDLLVYQKALEGVGEVSALLRHPGSAKETCGHLAVAFSKDYISKEELVRVSGLYDDLADMLSAFVDYLRRSDWDNRW